MSLRTHGFLITTLALGTAPRAPLPRVVPNDNRVAAGQLVRDTLQLRLVVQMATWHPEADTGRGIDVAAFAEEGRAPQIPAPLIRVRRGMVVRAMVRNALTDSSITLYGLHDRPAAGEDSIRLRPGDSVLVNFVAGEAGTYFYGANLGTHDHQKDDEREQLGGALVVDPPGGSPPDRILVLNIWGRSIDTTAYSNALTINGRSWPYSERLDATVGDTIRWRVISANHRGHPMHLHGFYYTILARGDSRRDTAYAPGSRRMAVTTNMKRFSTLTIQWVPNRPGNWLYHCHVGFHVTPEAARLDPPPADPHATPSHDPREHMAGLVLGITVHPDAKWRAPPRPDPMRLRLMIQEGKPRGFAERALGFVLQRGTRPPAVDSIEIPGSVLLLTKGRPTDVMVVNRLKEVSAIHWHGLELESWSDGVAGWSGTPTRTAPSIQPGDSFVAHLSAPRAGTFIYHTHMNDLEQLSSGLYGAIVVLNPGQRFDPRYDHLFIAGVDAGPKGVAFPVNGDTLAHDATLSAGTLHRFRFINIGVADPAYFRIVRDTTPVTWTALAKDGADLPRTQATAQPAVIRVNVGETYDFTWRPNPGTYRLMVGPPEEQRVVQQITVK